MRRDYSHRRGHPNWKNDIRLLLGNHQWSLYLSQTGQYIISHPSMNSPLWLSPIVIGRYEANRFACNWLAGRRT